MRSAGFGLGKKQQRNETPKRTVPPTSADSTQLLQSAQKNPDKPFAYMWEPPNQKDTVYALTCIISTSQRGDRRGWATSAADKAALGDADWRLTVDIAGQKGELFAMSSSDSMLILTLMDESLASIGAAAPGANAPSVSSYGEQLPQQPYEADPAAQQDPFAASYSGPPQTQAPAQDISTTLQEGNLRKTNIQSLMAKFNENKTTGRLICDIGTVQMEVFFTNGEPVHAKSCYSFHQDRDAVGNSVVVELLTWKEGNFKFQEGWPAASKSVTQPLAVLMSLDPVAVAAEAEQAREAVKNEEAARAAAAVAEKKAKKSAARLNAVAPPAEPDSLPPPPPPVAAPPPPPPPVAAPPPPPPPVAAPPPPPPPVASLPPPPAAPVAAPNLPPAPPPMPVPKPAAATASPVLPGAVEGAGFADDFSNMYDVIEQMYSHLVVSSGFLKYGMFLMLASTEFVRSESTKLPFCIASIAVELPGRTLSDEQLKVLGQCFEPVCQPLDILAYASPTRLFGLFPNSDAATAGNTLKHFANSIATTPLDDNFHGGELKVAIGLAEAPRDGGDLQKVLEQACKLRNAATVEHKVVTSTG